MVPELEEPHPATTGATVRPEVTSVGGVALGLRVALALVALGVALMGSGPRVGVTVDSGEYLAVAESLGSGSGYTMPYLSYDEPYPVDPSALEERVDLAHFPPAYPTVLAAADVVLPGGTVGTARWLSAIAFAVTTLALTSLCRRPGTAILTTLGVLSVDLVTIHSMAWSEPLLLASTAVAVVFALRYVEERRRADLVHLCLAVAMASGARFIGTAIGVGIAVGLVACSPSLRRPALQVAAAGVVPTVLWFVRNSIVLGDPSERDIAWHPPGAESLREAIESLSAWTNGEGWLGLLLLLPVLGLFLAARPVLARSLRDSARLQIALAGAGAYLAFLLGSRALIDSNIPLDIRLVAPIHLFLLMGLAALLDAGPADWPVADRPIDAGPIDARPIDARPIDARPVDAGLRRHRLLLPLTGASLLMGLAALLDAGPALATPVDAGLRRHRLLLSLTGASLLIGAVGGIDHAGDLSGQEASGYAADRWTGSEGIAYIEALRDDTTVVTNAPDAAWLLADHESLLFLPVGQSLYTGGPNLDYDAQLMALATTLRDRPGAVVVHFDRPTRSRSRWLTDETRSALGLTFVGNLGDATVWDVRGG